jgi:hypothetical protein
VIVAITLTLYALFAGQAAISATPHQEAAPAALAPAIQALMAPAGVRVTVGNTQLDFWFVKALPLKGEGAPSWAAVEEGTLIGAVRLSSDFRDIRGRLVKPGIYTFRYGIQPQNGDHLGVSPFRDFLLLSPAAVDREAAPRGHEGTVEMSTKTAGGSHPAAWSIDPPLATGAALTTHTTELGHKALIVEVSTSSAGTLRFGIVLVGRVDA